MESAVKCLAELIDKTEQNSFANHPPSEPTTLLHFRSLQVILTWRDPDAYNSQRRLTSYKPAWPAGFGTISYTYNNAGQKTSMSVPIGVTGKGRKMIYKYDSTGKRVGMDVVPCQIADAGDCWLDIPEGPQPNARYFYDPDYNRSAMITKANGDIYYCLLYTSYPLSK